MRKTVLVFLVILAFIIITVGCNKKENNITAQDNVKTTQENKPQPVSGGSFDSTGQIYTNSKMGFSITFPETWVSSFIVEEKNEDFIIISFTGKSKASKGYIGDKKYSNGLTMFFIGTEDAMSKGTYDSPQKIGAINGINYYYFTRTDSPIGSLTDRIRDNKFDDSEKELMRSDYTKAREMQKDVDSILKTFCAI